MRYSVRAMVVMMVVYLTALLLEADPSRLHHVVLAFTFILIVAGGHEEELRVMARVVLVAVLKAGLVDDRALKIELLEVAPLDLSDVQ